MKKMFRKLTVETWRSLSEESKEQMNENSVALIIKNKNFQTSKNILIYYAESHREIVFFDKLFQLFPEKNFFFPKIKENKLEFFKVDKLGEMKQGKFNILEPTENEAVDMNKVGCIFVPAVAAGRNLSRLGRGRGFYDRFLKTHTTPYRLCVLPFFSVFNEVPCESHDEKVHEVLEIQPFPLSKGI